MALRLAAAIQDREITEDPLLKPITKPLQRMPWGIWLPLWEHSIGIYFIQPASSRNILPRLLRKGARPRVTEAAPIRVLIESGTLHLPVRRSPDEIPHS